MTDFIRFIYCVMKAYQGARKTGKCCYNTESLYEEYPRYVYLWE